MISSSGTEIAGKKVTLLSSDKEVYEVEEVVVLEFKTIKDLVESGNDFIPLPKVTGEILSKIIEYCKKHVDAASATAYYKVSVNDGKFLQKIVEYHNENETSEFLSKIIVDYETHVDAASDNDDDCKCLWKIIEYSKKHPTGELLWKIIEDCKKYIDPLFTISDNLEAFDANFVKVDLGTLHKLMSAADFLDIKSLLDLTVTVARMIEGKTPDEIIETFSIQHNLTPEEEEEFKWTLEH